MSESKLEFSEFSRIQLQFIRPFILFQPYLEPRELIETLQEGRQATFVTVEHGAVKTVES